LKTRPAQLGFTLLELILVMLILAIVAAMVVPSLANFAISRTTDNTVIQIMSMAQYARTQCVADARPYRMNFDTQSGQVWLTSGSAGVFQPLTNDYGNRYTLGKGMKLQVQVTPQSNTQLVMDPNVQPADIQLNPIFGQPVWPSVNVIMQLPRMDGTYIEFLPTGRTDPALIKLTDQHGREIDMGLATSTEVMHVLKPEEMK
jgi:type II secretion system protein H